MKKKTNLLTAFIMMFLFIPSTAAGMGSSEKRMPDIKAEASFNYKEKKAALTIFIEKTPNEVKSLGFDLGYDPAVLKYSGYKKGQIIQNFTMFDAHRIKAGLIRAGGFHAGNSRISGKKGELITFHFDSINKGNPEIKIINLTDDISSWKVEIE
jgi:hypothetical protein